MTQGLQPTKNLLQTKTAQGILGTYATTAIPVLMNGFNNGFTNESVLLLAAATGTAIYGLVGRYLATHPVHTWNFLPGRNRRRLSS